MLDAGDRVLVAVSGGPDSIALLAVLSELAPSSNVALEAAHYHHGLRPVESDRDAACAEEVARRLKIRFHLGFARPDGKAGNIEERARLERYEFLRDLAARLGCRRVATGHTRDDQAETVLMRLLRGSGIDGLGGIVPARADGIIRPLIECDRQLVVAYLRARDLPFCEDSMNQDRRFLRSRIRHDIMPGLRAINPRLDRTLAQVAEMAAADANMLDALAAAAVEACTSEDGALDLGRLRAQPSPLRGRILRRWLSERRGTARGVAFVHVRALLDLAGQARSCGEVRLPHGGAVVREYGQLRFEPEPHGKQPQVAWSTVVTPDMELELAGGWRVTAQRLGCPATVPAGEPNLWCFWGDAAHLGESLVLRSLRPGDRIEPLGGAGRRKLQDIFVDRKVPRDRRWNRPALEARGWLVWVPGVARSRHALMSPSTSVAWRLVASESTIAGLQRLC